MAKNYTLEDVETLRSKAGVSYEDAVALLEKYDGDVARALIELEKRGQLGKEAQSVKFNMDDAVSWIKTMWHKGMNTRVIVERKGVTLVNLPVIILLLMLVLGVYAMVCAFVLTLVSGCNVSLQGIDNKEQTILKGEDERAEKDAAPVKEDIEPSIKADEPVRNDDDDFPSITVS